jgi:ATP-dependent exoDNAse (exonuclease V) beta subunit
MTKLVNGFRVPVTCSEEKLLLAKRNGHERDGNICFSDEGHLYFIRGSSDDLVSTTAFIHAYFESFDPCATALKLVHRPDFGTNPRYAIYRHLTADTEEETALAITASWEENGRAASVAGTLLHRNIELYYNDIKVDDPRVEFRKHFKTYHTHMETAGWVPFRTEWLVYDEDYKLTGSIDCVFHHPVSGKYIIRDWKMSKKISKFGFGKTGQPPLQHLPDCNYTHYALQQNVYKFLIERNYGLTIDHMAIVIFHSSNDNFIEFEIPDMQEDIHNMLAIRYISLEDFVLY